MLLYISEIINKNGDDCLIITDKKEFIPQPFDRLGDIMFRLGYTYSKDYTSIEIYKTINDKGIGDIIGKRNSKLIPIPEPDIIYHPNVYFGDFFNNMIIRMIKT